MKFRRTVKDPQAEDRQTEDRQAEDRLAEDRKTELLNYINKTVNDRETVKEGRTEQRRTEQRQTEQRRTEQRQSEQRQSEQRQTEQRQSEQRQSEQRQTEIAGPWSIARPWEDRQTEHRETEDRQTEDRRRAVRQSALWMGSCHIQEEPSELWRECAVTDVSTLGMGIDLCHPDPVELLGMWEDVELRLHLSRRITVHLELGPSVEMRIAGEVRNARWQTDGIVRAGIEFVGLTGTELSIVRFLERRAVRTKPRHARASQPVEARQPPSHV